MPKFNKQNKKRIDPRYFLEETINRDEDEPPFSGGQPSSGGDPQERASGLADQGMVDQMIAQYERLHRAFNMNYRQDYPHGDVAAQSRELDELETKIKAVRPEWTPGDNPDQKEIPDEVERDILKALKKDGDLGGEDTESDKGWTDSQKQDREARRRRIHARGAPGDDRNINQSYYGSDYHPNDPRSGIK